MQQTGPNQPFFDEHQAYFDPLYPFKPLDRYHALHYFEHSPFFDPDSNNTAARRDLQDINRPEVQVRYPTDKTEYIVTEDTAPHLFVVRKQQRTATAGAGARTITQNFYYILNQHNPCVYQAPTLHAAITGKLRKAMHFVREGYNKFREDVAPLPKVLREHQKEQDALQQQQLEKVAELNTDDDSLGLPALNAGGLTTNGSGKLAAAAGTAGGHGAGAAAVKPMMVPPQFTKEESEKWAQTDEMLRRVFDKYRAPALPLSREQKRLIEEQKRQREEAEQQQQAAANNAAAEPSEQTAARTAAPAPAAVVPAQAAASPADAAAVPAQPVEEASRSRKRRVQSDPASLDTAAVAGPIANAAAAAGAGPTGSTGRVTKKLRATSAGPTASAGAAGAVPAGSDYSQGSMGAARSLGSYGTEAAGRPGTAPAAGATAARRRAATPPIQHHMQQQGLAAAYQGAGGPSGGSPAAGMQVQEAVPGQASYPPPVAAAAALPVAVMPAASAPTRSGSLGGVSAMSHGTAATAASAGGSKMKLKFKLPKKFPGSSNLRQQSGPQGGGQQ